MKLTLLSLLLIWITSSWAQNPSGEKKKRPAAKTSSTVKNTAPTIQFNNAGLPYLGCMVKNPQGGFKEDTVCQCRNDKKNPCATASVNFDKNRYLAYNKYLGDKAAFDKETINLMEQVTVTVKEISDHYYRGEKSFPETLKKEQKLAKLNAQLKDKLATSPQAMKKSNEQQNAKLAELKIQYLDKLLQISNHSDIKQNHSLHRMISQALNSPARQTAVQSIAQQPNQSRTLATSTTETLQEPISGPEDKTAPFNLMGLSPKDARAVLIQIEKSASLAIQEEDNLFERITKTYHTVGITKLIDTETLLKMDIKKAQKVKSTKAKQQN